MIAEALLQDRCYCCVCFVGTLVFSVLVCVVTNCRFLRFRLVVFCLFACCIFVSLYVVLSLSGEIMLNIFVWGLLNYRVTKIV